MKEILKISITLMFIISMLAGCDNDNEPSTSCYHGKVVYLNKGGGCPNVIEITKQAKGGELTVGATISFNPELYGNPLKEGDDVYFKVVEYENFFGNIILPAICRPPRYAAKIEYCNN